MITLVVGAWLIAASGNPPDAPTLYSSALSSPSGTAFIVQSGPTGTKPFIRKTVRRGYSILQQESGGNSSIIIQQRSGD